MNAKRILFTAFVACTLTAFAFVNSSFDTNLVDNNTDKKIQKTIKLSNEFLIKLGGKEDFGKFETYTLFILTHKGKQVYIDSSLTEYEFSDKLFPIVRLIDAQNFEVLVEVNNRPNKNYLKYFLINNDKVIQTKNLPTFISKAKNLDDDVNLEYAGCWEWPEATDGNDSLSPYNPIVYFEIHPLAIKIDTELTRSINREIYGRFYGFQYSEAVMIKSADIKKWKKEIRRIENLK